MTNPISSTVVYTRYIGKRGTPSIAWLTLLYRNLEYAIKWRIQPIFMVQKKPIFCKFLSIVAITDPLGRSSGQIIDTCGSFKNPLSLHYCIQRLGGPLCKQC